MRLKKAILYNKQFILRNFLNYKNIDLKHNNLFIIFILSTKFY